MPTKHCTDEWWLSFKFTKPPEKDYYFHWLDSSQINPHYEVAAPPHTLPDKQWLSFHHTALMLEMSVASVNNAEAKENRHWWSGSGDYHLYTNYYSYFYEWICLRMNVRHQCIMQLWDVQSMLVWFDAIYKCEQINSGTGGTGQQPV